MYHQYFGLKEAPFSIAPNPHYLFMSKRHKEALAHLLYGVSHGGGFVLLTGEVGTGKTTVSRALLKQLPQNTDIAYILNPTLSATELLASICDELKIPYDSSNTSLKSLADKLHEFLLKNHAAGRNTVLIIDEAQHLGFKVMEQIRLLTNLETDEKKLLQIVFIGQPELNDLLAKQELRQLAQRITARFHIEPLSFAETQAYIRHRLMIAGMAPSGQLFSPTAIKIIFKACQGIPRLINVACDRALLGAYTQNSPIVDKATAQSAVAEATSDKQQEARARRTPIIAACVLSAAIIVTLMWMLVDSRQSANSAATALVSQADLTGTIARSQPAPTNYSEPEITPAPRELKPENMPATTEQAIAPAPQPEFSATQLMLGSFANESSAINHIQRELSVFAGDLPSPCEQLASFGKSCLREQLRSWEELIELNRPGVLQLMVNGELRYVAFGQTTDRRELGLLLGESSMTFWPMFELGRYWTGEVSVLWTPPDSFEPVLRPGDQSPFVAWVADAFAQLDGQPTPLADQTYNRSLEQRVILFQNQNELNPDGIVGVRTVLKLNDALASDFKLSQWRAN